MNSEEIGAHKLVCINGRNSTPMTTEIDHKADIYAIGNLVTSFQFLEEELLRVTVDMCMPGGQRAVSILASQLSFQKLALTFSALVSALSSNKQLGDDAKKLVGQLCNIEAERNKYVHSHYDIVEWTPRGQRILRRKHRVNKSGYEEREEWFDPSKIDEVVKQMGVACAELHGIEEKLIADGIIPSIEGEE